ncbi:TPA: DUF1240 domain-containing protein [Proteus mirabilis]|uniref:Protein of uncharacterized function (DUF1240) n=2 Tax=Proteus mirabilis TaxID=584 RepID=A0A379F057_PROMI|nr:DUF1240 domain-containing protein [Proteus mirabilis]ARA22068.1 hypothetical protein AM438_06040 [Proteus mirabilis]AUT93482.1 DUF1240 domain-containing protein [Proteus mirabilis]EEI49905.1 hypothetical protein HMPREF0693_0175 [Proteus mirabilis ATCC 29906]EKU3802966.1 DUF1240 domain-containing protein [Proteus mirabilis]EKV0742150.1 DUF1240 domain-containing protein [Proteus mirabilis]
MVKINSLKMYLIAIFLFSLALFCFYDSIIYYKNYFMMKDRILFSFQTGLFFFAAPLIIYFSYLIFICGYTKKTQRMNNKVAGICAGIAIVGIVFSFFFSIYVGLDLTSKGYFSCYKSSAFAPNEYVIAKEMCKK